MKVSEGQVDIYVELDGGILDTVAGTLHLLNPEIAEQVINKDYQKRTSDTFEGIDRQKFRDRYAKRDADTIQVSCISNGYKLVRKLAQTAAMQLAERPYYKGCKIVVNCHPYNISPEVKEEMLKALYVWIGTELPIELVDWPLSVLTPSRCKKEFGVLIMYNPQDWFNLHMAQLQNNPMPEVIMLSAKIHHVLQPDEQQTQQLNNIGPSPFLAFEMLARPLVSLDLIEVENFSIVDLDGI
jgi:hypothetical protein